MIVMVSSVNGFEPAPRFAHYNASKHGLVGLMKTLALELAPFGVRCNSLHPGAVRTGMTDDQTSLDLLGGRPGATLDDLMVGGQRYGALRGSTFMDP